MKRLRWMIGGLLFLAFGAVAQDDLPDLSLPEDLATELKLFESMPIVITAARKPQRITEASSTIDVLTAEDIKRSGSLTLAELLERLPGVYTPRAHNAQDMLWIRGVGGRYNDNALLLIDGVPYRTLYYSHFPINEQVPLEDIKKVEVIRGPGSALYGTGAFSGVINIITKDAIDLKHNKLSLGGGTWNTQNHFTHLRQEFEQGEITFFGKYFDSDGYRARRDDEGAATDLRREAENQYYKLRLKLYDFDVNLRYSRFGMNDFTAAEDEEEEGGREAREHFSGQIAHQIELNKSVTLQTKVYYNSYNLKREGDAFDDEDGVDTKSRTRQDGDVAGLDLLLYLNLSPSHTVIAGLNYEHEKLDHASTQVAASPFEDFDFTDFAAVGGAGPEAIENNNIGIYLEDEYKVGEQWILTGGIRYDAFEASDSSWSPRVSAVYTPDNKTAIKWRYGEAFRAPTYQELYRRTEDGEGEGSTGLDPQTIRTAEFEVSRFLGENHRLNTTVFYSEFEKFIKVIGDGDFENLPEREFYGLEFGLHGNLNSDLNYFANYSYTQAEEFDRSDIAGVPEHMGNIGLTYSALPFADISPHLRVVGARNRPLNYQGDVPEENRQDLLGGYALLNMTVVLKGLPGSFEASVSVRNLLDETYHTSGEQTEDFDVLGGGRRILLNLSTSF